MKYDYKNSDKMPSKAKQNLINKSTLTPAKKLKMMYHANHHKSNHISLMIKKITNDKMTFKQSHKFAIDKLG